MSETSDQVIGKIRKLDERGYGFIETDEHGRDVFFHAKDVRRARFEQLRIGDKVCIGEVYQKGRIDPKTGDEIQGWNAKEIYLVN